MDSRGEPGEAIAIVGIACQFPGARDPAELHHLTMAGTQMFQPVPGLRAVPGQAALPGRAALVDGWTVQFGEVPDPGPVHKLATETAAQALSDAGYGRPGTARADAGRHDTGRHEAGPLGTGQRAGLIIASAVGDLCEVARDGFRIGPEGRFPQAAYLDSLHAIAASCDTLSAGELDVVIAGGAELGIDQDWLARLAAAGDLATGDMRVYDAEPTGLLPGDGCGVVVLMRSADARAAGLPVYAEIAGWSTARRADLAYTRAGVAPGDIGLIEGHGAGTAGGDLAELAELARLRRGAATTAALGAVSANIGQARSAAGAASLIKVVVAMVAGAVPPTTGCVRPHELIESGAARLRVPEQAEPWPDGVRLAAVNSPGPDGAAEDGIHLVLRRETDHGRGHGRRRRASAPLPTPRPASPGRHSAPADVTVPASDDATVVLPAVPPAASVPAPAPSEPPQATTANAAEWVSERAMPATIFALCGAEPAAVAATLDVVAASVDELTHADVRDLARHLAVAAQRAAERGAPLRVTVTATGPRQLSGQARRAAGMLRHWNPGAQTPVSATTVTEPGIGISSGATGTIAVVFPGLACTAAEHTTLLTSALNGMRLLDLLGVTPDSAVGYGFGELAGLVWAGCLPTAEAARLAVLRAQVLRACAVQPTALVRVGCDSAEASRLCATGGAQVAVYETPGSCVLAGSSAGIRDLMRRAGALGIPATLLAGGRAQHCTATARCVAPLRGVLADTVFGTPRRRLVSSITGLPVTPDDDIAELLAAQPSRPVLFEQALTLAVRRNGRPPADLIVVAGPDADPASPMTSAGEALAPSTLAAIATAASGLPAITLPSAARPSAALPTAGTAAGPTTGTAVGTADGAADEWLARTVAALFTAGAIRDLTPYLRTPQPDPAQAPWTIPPMRDAGTAETGGGTGLSGSSVSSARKVLMGELPGLLPVRSQRHVGRSVLVQLDTQNLVQLDLVAVEAKS
jgi:enediyne polyketide synthase